MVRHVPLISLSGETARDWLWSPWLLKGYPAIIWKGYPHGRYEKNCRESVTSNIWILNDLKFRFRYFFMQLNSIQNKRFDLQCVHFLCVKSMIESCFWGEKISYCFNAALNNVWILSAKKEASERDRSFALAHFHCVQDDVFKMIHDEKSNRICIEWLVRART